MPHGGLNPYMLWMQFGVVREDGVNKAFGAGILSSFGEMEHMASVRLLLPELCHVITTLSSALSRLIAALWCKYSVSLPSWGL